MRRIRGWQFFSSIIWLFHLAGAYAYTITSTRLLSGFYQFEDKSVLVIFLFDVLLPFGSCIFLPILLCYFTWRLENKRPLTVAPYRGILLSVSMSIAIICFHNFSSVQESHSISAIPLQDLSIFLFIPVMMLIASSNQMKWRFLLSLMFYCAALILSPHDILNHSIGGFQISFRPFMQLSPMAFFWAIGSLYETGISTNRINKWGCHAAMTTP
jgi:hypothetical protein